MTRTWSHIVLFLSWSGLTVASTVHILPSSDRNRLVRGGAAAASTKMIKKYAEIDRMPSLFAPEDEELDRYAACLAATEGLRRMRDQQLSDEKMRTKGNEAKNHITAQYVQNSSKVLKALGMSVGHFNALGRRIAQDEALKQKVMEQAYLYRMAATVDMDRAHLIEDPASNALLQAFRRDKLQMFCESMTEIENLRSDQVERLKRALHVDKLPSHLSISDPSLLPFLSPKVRAVVEAFPLQAEEIVKKHGLQSDEFNKMLVATRSNPMFRWKIKKEMQTVGSANT